MAVPPLEALLAAGHHIELVVTGADRRRGRGGATSPSPVKAAALDHGLPVSHAVDDVLSTDAELGVVVAFGKIIRPHVLQHLPMINLHFSLLPRWRGAAPVERAILAGDRETGVAVMEVEEGLDTGGIFAERVVPIPDDATSESLSDELVAVGSALLVATLAAGLGEPRPQSGDPVYASKFTADDYRLDWDETPSMIDRRVRVGGAWTTFRGERVKIHAGRLVDGRYLPTVVQPAGKSQMTFEDWRNGAQPVGDEWFE